MPKYGFEITKLDHYFQNSVDAKKTSQLFKKRANSKIIVAPYKGIRIPKSGKFLHVESGIRGILLVKNSSSNLESHYKVRNPSFTDKASGIHGAESRIQDFLEEFHSLGRDMPPSIQQLITLLVHLCTCMFTRVRV